MVETLLNAKFFSDAAFQAEVLKEEKKKPSSNSFSQVLWHSYRLQVKENEDLIVLKAQLHFWEWFWRNGINWLQSSLTVSILFRGLKKTDTVTALHFQPRLRSCRRLHLNSSSNLWVSHLVRHCNLNTGQARPLICTGGLSHTGTQGHVGPSTLYLPISLHLMELKWQCHHLC